MIKIKISNNYFLLLISIYIHIIFLLIILRSPFTTILNLNSNQIKKNSTAKVSFKNFIKQKITKQKNKKINQIRQDSTIIPQKTESTKEIIKQKENQKNLEKPEAKSILKPILSEKINLSEIANKIEPDKEIENYQKSKKFTQKIKSTKKPKRNVLKIRSQNLKNFVKKSTPEKINNLPKIVNIVQPDKETKSEEIIQKNVKSTENISQQNNHLCENKKKLPISPATFFKAFHQSYQNENNAYAQSYLNNHNEINHSEKSNIINQRVNEWKINEYKRKFIKAAHDAIHFTPGTYLNSNNRYEKQVTIVILVSKNGKILERSFHPEIGLKEAENVINKWLDSMVLPTIPKYVNLDKFRHELKVTISINQGSGFYQLRLL